MIVRFDSQKLQHNTMADIGVESEISGEKGGLSEVDMLVGEARRNSLAANEGALDESSEDLKDIVEQEEEAEPGPELTPEGNIEAERILNEKKQEGAGATTTAPTVTTDSTVDAEKAEVKKAEGS